MPHAPLSPVCALPLVVRRLQMPHEGLSFMKKIATFGIINSRSRPTYAKYDKFASDDSESWKPRRPCCVSCASCTKSWYFSACFISECKAGDLIFSCILTQVTHYFSPLFGSKGSKKNLGIRRFSRGKIFRIIFGAKKSKLNV